MPVLFKRDSSVDNDEACSMYSPHEGHDSEDINVWTV